MKRAPVLLVLLAGCGGKSAEECRAEATAVGDLLVEAAKDVPAPFVIGDDVPLVTRTDLRLQRDLQQGPVVTLGATIRHGDKQVPDLDVLAASLRAEHEKLLADLEAGRYSRRWVRDDRLVYFAIDPATPWERVVAVVGTAASAGLASPAFVFAA